MYLFDHNTPSWRQMPHLINGAITYSEDIIKLQLDNWAQVLGADDLLSTAPPPTTFDFPSNVRTAIIYLHSWPLEEDKKKFATRYETSAKQTIYISAYREYTEILREWGYKAVYIPMSIDVNNIQQYAQPKTSPGFIYYGNVTNVKRPVLKLIRKTCEETGYIFDAISYNKFNRTQVLTREEALSIVSTYQYGIGVGRCALEMFALGLKVIIAGRSIGGLIMNEADYKWQEEVNMNGRVYTYTNDIKECLARIDKSIIRLGTVRNHAIEVLNIYRLSISQ